MTLALLQVPDDPFAEPDPDAVAPRVAIGPPPTWAPSPGKVLVLRTCTVKPDGTMWSPHFREFQWPTEIGATVTAPDWAPSKRYGEGLHGYLWGRLDGTLRGLTVTDTHVVLEVDEADLIELVDVWKFRSGRIVYIGDHRTALALVTAHDPELHQARRELSWLSEHEHPLYSLELDSDYPTNEHPDDVSGMDPEPLSQSVNTIGSPIVGRPGMHTVLVDIDHPVRVVQSSTPGHYHLYIDVPMPWWRYRKLLRAMSRAGLVEPGYYQAAVRRRATYLRLPWTRKGNS